MITVEFQISGVMWPLAFMMIIGCTREVRGLTAACSRRLRIDVVGEDFFDNAPADLRMLFTAMVLMVAMTSLATSPRDFRGSGMGLCPLLGV